MARIRVRRLGAFWPTDASGNLVGPAARGAIADGWAEAVDYLVGAYLEEWGEVLHSVYVRGSVARGLAVAGVADLDTFAVLAPGLEDTGDTRRLNAWDERVQNALRAEFPFVAGVEADLVPFADALDRANPYAFTIKAEALCMHGEDLSPSLEPFAPSPEIAFQARWFRYHLDTFVAEYPAEPEEQKPGFIAWLMKRFLRLGMELVMVEEGQYTRDLYLCYETFSLHYPARADAMRRALELAINPAVGPEAEAFALEFGSWLAAEAERKLAAWAVDG